MPVVHGFPVAVAKRQIPPRRTGSGPPQHPIDNLPMIHPPATSNRGPVRQQRLQPGPLFIRQIVTVLHKSESGEPDPKDPRDTPLRRFGVCDGPGSCLAKHALYRAAKADPGRRFHTLSDKVYGRDVLERAWVNVRRNGGADGIDRTSIADVQEYGVPRLLDELVADLKVGRWRPQPARRVFIPKPGSREMHPLSIPTVRDRIVQAAVKIVLEPRQIFCPARMGFAPTGERTMRYRRSITWFQHPSIITGFWRLTLGPVWMRAHTAPFLIVMPRTVFVVVSAVRCGGLSVVVRSTACRSPALMLFMIVLRVSWWATVASNIASHPSGAWSTNSALTCSVRRIRPGAPGVSARHRGSLR